VTQRSPKRPGRAGALALGIVLGLLVAFVVFLLLLDPA
jgi:hypothetical protein